MAVTSLANTVRRLHQRTQSALKSDAELLQLFRIEGEVEAFTELVRRHAPLVLGVCRRVTGNHHDAEDAFQAVFVTLLRKAHTVRAESHLGAWLYRVAYHAALEAKSMRSRSKQRETPLEHDPPARDERSREESWRPLLDQELARLPERFRAPIVLCDLEGVSRKDAAATLKIPEGTLSSRLARGRQMLAERMRRHGVTASLAALFLAVQPSAFAAPAALIDRCTAASLAFASGKPLAEAFSLPVVLLSQGVLKNMLISKLQSSVSAVSAILVVLALASWQFVAQAQDPPRALESTRANPVKKDAQIYMVDIDLSQPNPFRVIAADPQPLSKERVTTMKLAVEAGQMARGWLGSPVSQVTSDGRDNLGPRVRTRVIPAKKAGWVHVEAILEKVTLLEKDDQPKIAVERLGYVKTDLPIKKDLVIPTATDTSSKAVQMTRIRVSPLEELPQGWAPPLPKDVPLPPAAILPTAHAAPATARTTPAAPSKTPNADAKLYRIEIQTSEGKELTAMPRISVPDGQEWTVQTGQQHAVPDSNPIHWVPVGLTFTGSVTQAESGKVRVRLLAQHAKLRTEKKVTSFAGTDTQGMNVAYTTKLGESVNFRIGANGPRLMVTVFEMKLEE